MAKGHPERTIPAQLNGRQEVVEFWQGSPDLYDALHFELGDLFTQGPQAVVFFTSHNQLKGGGGVYNDQHIGLFTFNEAGLIQSYVEYFDPINLGETFGMIKVEKLEDLS